MNEITFTRVPLKVMTFLKNKRRILKVCALRHVLQRSQFRFLRHQSARLSSIYGLSYLQVGTQILNAMWMSVGPQRVNGLLATEMKMK
jgi:hypothetical protein